MDYSPPDSSVHGILQARILEWVAIHFSRGSSQLRDRTWVSSNAGRFFTTEPPGNPPLDKRHTPIISKKEPFLSEVTCEFVVGFLVLFFNTDFPGGSDGKVSAYSVGDLGLTPGLGRSSGEGNGNPLQYSCLENPMDRGV